MTELERQMLETKKEVLLEFKRELMKRLKNDDRTVIYINFLNITDEVATSMINELGV